MENIYWLKIKTLACGKGKNKNTECSEAVKGNLDNVTSDADADYVMADIGLRINKHNLNPAAAVVDVFGDIDLTADEKVPFIHGAAEGVISGELVRLIAENTDFGLEGEVANLFKNLIGKAKFYLGNVGLQKMPANEKNYAVSEPIFLDDIMKKKKTKEEANYIMVNSDAIPDIFSSEKPFSLFELAKLYSLLPNLEFPSDIRILVAKPEVFDYVYDRVKNVFKADVAEGYNSSNEIKLFSFRGKQVNQKLRDDIKQDQANIMKLCLKSVTTEPLQKHTLYLRPSGQEDKVDGDSMASYVNGFDLSEAYRRAKEIAEERSIAKKNNQFDEADRLRKEIAEIGFMIQDVGSLTSKEAGYRLRV